MIEWFASSSAYVPARNVVRSPVIVGLTPDRHTRGSSDQLRQESDMKRTLALALAAGMIVALASTAADAQRGGGRGGGGGIGGMSGGGMSGGGMGGMGGGGG